MELISDHIHSNYSKFWIACAYEEVNYKTASDHFICFSFSFLYKINEQTWFYNNLLVFTLYHSRKINKDILLWDKIGEQSRTALSYFPNAYFITYLNEKHVKWSEAVLQFTSSNYSNPIFTFFKFIPGVLLTGEPDMYIYVWVKCELPMKSMYAEGVNSRHDRVYILSVVDWITMT